MQAFQHIGCHWKTQDPYRELEHATRFHWSGMPEWKLQTSIFGCCICSNRRNEMAVG